MTHVAKRRTRPRPDAHAGVRSQTIRNYIYDFDRFLRASFLTETREQEHRRASIYILAHSIEHGMSLSDPRIGFGFAKVQTLLTETCTYLDHHGSDETAAMALKVLDAYVAFNTGAGPSNPALQAELDALDARLSFRQQDVLGGTEDVSLERLRAITDVGFLDFMEARHSVRQYAEKPVERAEVELAVSAAQQSPSSCNRQTCRVYAFTDRAAIAKVMAFPVRASRFRPRTRGLAHRHGRHGPSEHGR